MDRQGGDSGEQFDEEYWKALGFKKYTPAPKTVAEMLEEGQVNLEERVSVVMDGVGVIGSFKKAEIIKSLMHFNLLIDQKIENYNMKNGKDKGIYCYQYKDRYGDALNGQEELKHPEDETPTYAENVIKFLQEVSEVIVKEGDAVKQEEK